MMSTISKYAGGFYMHVEFEREWRSARAHENEGNLDQAERIYDSLIKVDPDRLYVRLRLSAIEQSKGRYLASRAHALFAADTVKRGRWKDLGVVTRRLLAFDEHALIGELIAGADWSSPAVLKDAAMLAQHLWLIGRVEEAFDFTETALRHVPISPNLSYGRANVLKYLGRADEATAEYERAITLEANSPYVHWSLAYHAKSRPPGARINRVLAAKRSFPGQALEQAYFDYALFKEYEDAGQFEQAWTHLQQGARIKRKHVPYDSQAEEAGFAALEKEFDSVVPGPGTTSLAPSPVPIFIVGMPRTGTTLLERILGNSPEVQAGGELNDFNSALCRTADAFIGTVATPGLAQRLRNVDLGDVGREYLARTSALLRGARFLVDKNPVNFIYAGYIAKALPQARILCLRRNPMDACFSNLKELFSNEAYGYSYDLDELGDHYLRFERLSNHWQRMLPAQFMRVDYESLVMEPIGTARLVLEFCGLPFAPEVVDITRNVAPVSTASSTQVRAPIHAKSVDAWLRYEPYFTQLKKRFETARNS